MQLNRFLLLILLMLLGSCIDRFIPETAGYDSVLFMECLVSDDTASLPVLRISRSAPIATLEGDKLTLRPDPVTGASATLICSDGTSTSFYEDAPGIYYPSASFRPVAGKSYKLQVTCLGNQFESDLQRLNPSPPIDSISHRVMYRKASEDGSTEAGYQFYASTHGYDQGSSFYRWILQADFVFTVPYQATHIYTGSGLIPSSNQHIRTCWKTKPITGFFISSTQGLDDNRIIEAPLNFESQKGDELMTRYSLKVRQLCISESALAFWKDVTDLVVENGGLYESQPYRIKGNIKCVSDPEMYVAGIFEVAGISETRIFVDRPTEFPVYPVECILMAVGTRDFPWYRLPAGSYVTLIGSSTYMTASPSCYDCRLREGTLDKPPFWKD